MTNTILNNTATDMVVQNAEFKVAELSLVYLIKHERSDIAQIENDLLRQNDKAEVSVVDLSHFLSGRRQLRHDIRSLDALRQCHADMMPPIGQTPEPMSKVLEVIDHVTDEQIICATSRQIGTLENLQKDTRNIVFVGQITRAKRCATNFIGTVRRNIRREPVFLYA